ncbi:hypothetical protein ACLB1R_34875 [Escherichia coli]
MAEDELKRKQSLMGTMDVKMLFHARPSQKMLVARYKKWLGNSGLFSVSSYQT